MPKSLFLLLCVNKERTFYSQSSMFICSADSSASKRVLKGCKNHILNRPRKRKKSHTKLCFFSAKISEKIKNKKISVVPPASNMEPVAALRHTINCLEELQCHSVLLLYNIQHCIPIIYTALSKATFCNAPNQLGVF